MKKLFLSAALFISCAYLHAGDYYRVNASSAEFKVPVHSSNTLPLTDSTYDLGSSTKQWRNIYVDSITVTNAGGISINSNTFRYVPWTAYTPGFSAGWGTAADIAVFYRIVGDSMEVRGNFTTGTVAASSGTISMPTGYQIDSAKVGTAGVTLLGWIYEVANANSNIYVDSKGGVLFYVSSGDKTNMCFAARVVGLEYQLTNVNAFYTSGSRASFYASFPVTAQ